MLDEITFKAALRPEGRASAEELAAARAQPERTEAEAYAQMEQARKASEALIYLTPLANDPLDW